VATPLVGGGDGWGTLASVAVQLLGTFVLRPYVVGFLFFFLVAGVRDIGGVGTVAFLLWGGAVALVAELTSTRIGVPFGLYHYTGATRAAELFLGNVPFFSPLSFPFLAYASFCLARRTFGPRWATTERVALEITVSRSAASAYRPSALLMILEVTTTMSPGRSGPGSVCVIRRISVTRSVAVVTSPRPLGANSCTITDCAAGL